MKQAKKKQAKKKQAKKKQAKKKQAKKQAKKKQAEEASKEEASKEEASKEEASEEASKEEASEEASKEDASKEEASEEEASKEEASEEEASEEEASKEEANEPKSKHTDDEMFKGMSVLDDKLLPCYKLNLSQALIEIKKNPKCVPFQIYLERWKYFNDKYKKMNKLIEKPKPVINDALLPPLTLTLPVAISKIKSNPLCVPFEAYMKRWNELKTTKKHNTMIK